MFENITGIVICCNTKDLIERAYSSVREFHPEMPIIIIDGSDSKNPCAVYLQGLHSEKTEVISLKQNIGHGKGICMGINRVKTKYALIFDSDIEMLKSPVGQMLEMMEEDTFGVGAIGKIGFDGIDYGKTIQHRGTNYILYLHPSFQLININNYRKYHRYVHHGAPCYLTMIDIHNKSLSERILKNFPNLETFIKHYGWGTRRERKNRGLSSIEAGWE